jgi:hypothetical protein
MIRVCIHQPDFAPYLGFFDRLLDVDVFIVLDDAQFVQSGGWHHRDKIKSRQGANWLTLSVQKCPLRTPINHVLLSTKTDWRRNNLNLIADSYASAPCFAEMFPLLQELYLRPHAKLVDMNLALLDFAYGLLDLKPNVILSSEIGVASARNQRLIDLIKAVGGTHYLSGTGALAYLEPKLFEEAGIGLTIQSFKHPVYPQLHGPFLSHLSCLDLFLNCGSDSAAILRSVR